MVFSVEVGEEHSIFGWRGGAVGMVGRDFTGSCGYLSVFVYGAFHNKREYIVRLTLRLDSSSYALAVPGLAPKAEHGTYYVLDCGQRQCLKYATFETFGDFDIRWKDHEFGMVYRVYPALLIVHGLSYTGNTNQLTLPIPTAFMI